MNRLEKCVLFSLRRSVRLDYVLELMRLCWPEVTISLTEEHAEPQKGLLRLAYGLEVDGHISMPDEGLLWETGHSDHPSPLKQWNAAQKTVESLFINQDILSSIFYVATRYEEYNGDRVDEHERWQGEGSDLDMIQLLETPAIPFWLGELCNMAGFNIPKSPRRNILSCDIDQAFKYKNRGGLRTLLSLFQKEDPYDTYALLNALSKRYSYEMKYFIPAADQRSAYDEAAHPSEAYMKSLGELLTQHADIGLHPGYFCAEDEHKLRKEKNDLEKSWNIKVDAVRMHYLRSKLPDTYQIFIRNGIQHDHTMGYADRVGWRSGMHVAFPWYDVENDRCTSLTLHPLPLMDVTIKNYLNLSEESLKNLCQKFKNVLSIYGGDWCVLWHNTSFDPREGWTSDGSTLEKFLAV